MPRRWLLMPVAEADLDSTLLQEVGYALGAVALGEVGIDDLGTHALDAGRGGLRGGGDGDEGDGDVALLESGGGAAGGPGEEDAGVAELEEDAGGADPEKLDLDRFALAGQCGRAGLQDRTDGYRGGFAQHGDGSGGPEQNQVGFGGMAKTVGGMGVDIDGAASPGEVDGITGEGGEAEFALGGLSDILDRGWGMGDGGWGKQQQGEEGGEHLGLDAGEKAWRAVTGPMISAEGQRGRDYSKDDGLHDVLNS